MIRPGSEAEAFVRTQRQSRAFSAHTTHIAKTAPAPVTADQAPEASRDPSSAAGSLAQPARTRLDPPAPSPALAGGPRLQITVEIDLADLTLAMETFKAGLPGSARIDARPALGLSQDKAPCAPLALTARQWQILALIGEGLSNKVIARWLGLSHFTVRNHLSQILLSMGLASRQQARAAFAALTPAALADATR